MQSLTAAFFFVSSFVGAQSIDPSTIDPVTRQTWCTSQVASCPLICTQIQGGSASYLSDTCNSTTLAYSCVCANGQSPNASEYSQTIPYFECTTNNNNCVAACPASDNTCQAACRQNHPCGATDPRRYNITSTSSSTSTSATSTTTNLGGTTTVSVTVTATDAAGSSNALAAATQTAQSLNGNSGSGSGGAMSGADNLSSELVRLYDTMIMASAWILGFVLLA